MALLTETQRQECNKEWIIRGFVALGATATLDKDDLKATVDTTDQWIEDKQVSFNQSLPEPFKSTATLEQKTLMLVYVSMKRAGLI